LTKAWSRNLYKNPLIRKETHVKAGDEATNRKTVALTLLLLLSFLVLGLQTVIVVRANFKPAPLPAVHITSTGDVSNSSALVRSGVVYTFTGNWSTCVLEVERSNIVIDGAGFFIIGNGRENGIVLHGVSNVKISNVNIADTNAGIYLENCSDVTIDGCSVTGGNHGVYLNCSKNNAVSGNRLSSNFNGMYLDHSGSNVLRDNHITADSTSYGLAFMVTGESLADYVNDVDESNLVNGKSIIYWVGRQDVAVPPDAAYVALVNCRAITVQNQQISKTQGILVAWTANSTITNNLLHGNFNGIQVLHSSNIIVSGNQIWENTGLDEGGDGVNLANSQFVTVANNQVTGNWNGGITCTNSSGNQLIGNVITRNWHNGINLVDSSDYNIVTLNHVYNHTTMSRGAIYIQDSTDNYLTANNLTDNGCWGIQLKGEQGNNTFYGNNFVNNSYIINRRTPDALQISTPGTANGNSWDNGSLGNYWSDYGGSDANGDGIGDSPYYINPTNQDNYPLLNLVSTSEVSLIAPKLPSSMLSSQGNPVQQLPEFAIAASALIAAMISLTTVVYLKKRKHEAELS
jgi:parallel beta-helix repeat protein